MVDAAQLVQAAALPVIQVVLMALSGGVLVWKGVLDRDKRKALSAVTYNLFLPMLIFVSLVSSVTGPKLLRWWPIPINVALSVGLGMAVGALLAPILNIPRHLRAHYICCAGVGNLGNLPLVLVPEIAKQSDLFTEADAATGVAYVVTGLFAILIAQFNVAYNLLRLPDARQRHTDSALSCGSSSAMNARARAGSEVGHGASSDGAPEAMHLQSCAELGELLNGAAQENNADAQGHGASAGVLVQVTGTAQNTGIAEQGISEPSKAVEMVKIGPVDMEGRMHDLSHTRSLSEAATGSAQIGHCCEGGALPESSGGELAQGTAPHLVGDPCSLEGAMPLNGADCSPPHVCQLDGKIEFDLVSVSDKDSDLGPWHNSHDACPSGAASSRGTWPTALKLAKGAWRGLLMLCTLPTATIVVSLVIAVIPPVQRLFVVQPGSAEAELPRAEQSKPPLDVITQAADRLGAAMIPCLMVALGAALWRRPGTNKLSWHVILSLVVLRLILLPVLGAVLVLGTEALGWWSAPDDMFRMVMLLQHAMPTALNMHVVATMHRNHDDEVAEMLFWQYVGCVFSIPAYIAASLHFIER